MRHIVLADWLDQDFDEDERERVAGYRLRLTKAQAWQVIQGLQEALRDNDGSLVPVYVECPWSVLVVTDLDPYAATENHDSKE